MKNCVLFFLLSYMDITYAGTAQLVYGDHDNGYNKYAEYDLKVIHYVNDEKQLVSAYIEFLGQDYIIIERDNQESIVYHVVYDATPNVADAQLKRICGKKAQDVIVQYKQGALKQDSIEQLYDADSKVHNDMQDIEKPDETINTCIGAADTSIATQLSTPDNQPCTITGTLPEETGIHASYTALHNIYLALKKVITMPAVAGIAGVVCIYWAYSNIRLAYFHAQYQHHMKWSDWKDKKQIMCIMQYGKLGPVLCNAIMHAYAQMNKHEAVQQFTSDIDCEIDNCRSYLARLHVMNDGLSSWVVDVSGVIDNVQENMSMLLFLKKSFLLWYKGIADSKEF